MALSLIVGGARSGKSELAQRLAAASTLDVLFAATMEPNDDELAARVEAHRAARPAGWRTIEEPLALVEALERESHGGECVVIDCVTMWVSNMLLARFGESDAIDVGSQSAVLAETRAAAAALSAWAAAHRGGVIAVTNEVGSGVVPAYALGRVFRDALGGVNALLATSAERVYTVTAGFAIELRGIGGRPVDSFGPEVGR